MAHQASTAKLKELLNPDYQGWLYKQGQNVKSWKKRFCVLKGSKIYYFASQKPSTTAKGEMDIEGAVVVSTSDNYHFSIVTPARIFEMQSTSAQDMRSWMEAIMKISASSVTPTSPPRSRATTSIVQTPPPPSPTSQRPSSLPPSKGSSPLLSSSGRGSSDNLISQSMPQPQPKITTASSLASSSSTTPSPSPSPLPSPSLSRQSQSPPYQAPSPQITPTQQTLDSSQTLSQPPPLPLQSTLSSEIIDDWELIPTQPGQPAQSPHPSQASQPSQLSQSSQPLQPSQPSQSAQPSQPSQLSQLSQPSQPSQPTQPLQPPQPSQSLQPVQPISSSHPSRLESLPPTQPTQSTQSTQSTRLLPPTSPVARVEYEQLLPRSQTPDPTEQSKSHTPPPKFPLSQSQPQSRQFQAPITSTNQVNNTSQQMGFQPIQPTQTFNVIQPKPAQSILPVQQPLQSLPPSTLQPSQPSEPSLPQSSQQQQGGEYGSWGKRSGWSVPHGPRESNVFTIGHRSSFSNNSPIQSHLHQPIHTTQTMQQHEQSNEQKRALEEVNDDKALKRKPSNPRFITDYSHGLTTPEIANTSTKTWIRSHIKHHQSSKSFSRGKSQPEINRAVKRNRRKEFRVIVHVIGASDLIGRLSTGAVDPICFVEINGKSKHTQIIKNSSNCTWDRIFVFDFDSVEEIWKHETITMALKVFNAASEYRNELIGEHLLDLKGVYTENDHCLQRLWFALSGDTGLFAGYVRASVVVLRENDPVPCINSDVGSDVFEPMKVLHPGVEISQYYFNVKIFRGQDIYRHSKSYRPNPRVVVSLSGITLKTKAGDKTESPLWNVELKFALQSLTLHSDILFLLFDKIQKSKYTLVSMRSIKFSEVLQAAQKDAGPFWIYFYSDGMNLTTSLDTEGQSNEPTSFKGRILVEMGVSPANEPKSMRNYIAPFKGVIQEKTYVMRVDLYEATDLCIPPGPPTKHITFELLWGTFKVVGTAPCKKNGAQWYKAFDQISADFHPHSIPDAFINMYSVDGVGTQKRIGVLRLKADSLTLNQVPKWEPLVSPGEDEINCGYILCGISCGLYTEIKNLPRSPMRLLNYDKYIVRAYIYQGRCFPDEDIGAQTRGRINSYCNIKVGSQSKSTSQQEMALAPQWFETVELECQLPTDFILAPNISITVFSNSGNTTLPTATSINSDMVKSEATPDEIVGDFFVQMMGLTSNPSPLTWYPLFHSKGAGEVLACFQVFEAKELRKFPVTNITPQYKNAVVELAVVGLRNLTPFDMDKIQNPFVVFDLSVSEKGRGRPISKTPASCTPSGSNPNHFVTLTMETKLPLSNIFTPYLNVRVFDNRSGQEEDSPLICSTSIPLSQYLPWSNWSQQPDKTKRSQKRLSKLVDVGKHRSSNSGWKESMDSLGKNENELDVKSREPTTSKMIEYITTLDGRSIPLVEDNSSDAVDDVKRATLSGNWEDEILVPFNDFSLIRGAKKQKFAYFEQLNQDREDPFMWHADAGLLRGNIKVLEGAPSSPPLNLTNCFRSASYVVRVYVLKASKLIAREPNGLANAYIGIAAGKGVESKDRTKYVGDSLSPHFDRCYELTIEFPKNAELVVSVYDWSATGNDELIGCTKINLENRIFCNEWTRLRSSPIEQRTLWHPTSASPQGEIGVWIDILSAQEAKTRPQYYMGPKQLLRYEMHVVLWEVREVPVGGEENASSVFIEANMDGQAKQATDIRWANKGTAKLNCMMKYYIELPSKLGNKIKLQVKTEAGEEIASGFVDLLGFFRRARRENRRVYSIPKQYVGLGHEGVELEMQIDLLNEEEAIQRHELALGRASPMDVQKRRHPFQVPPLSADSQSHRSGSDSAGSIRPHVSLADFTNNSYTSFSLASMDEIPFIDKFPEQTCYQRHKKKIAVIVLISVVLIFGIIIYHVLMTLGLVPNLYSN